MKETPPIVADADNDDNYTEILEELAQTINNSRFAWLPVCVCEGLSTTELRRLMINAGFDFQPDGSNIVSASAGKNGVFLPTGWTYSEKPDGGLRNDKGEIVATNKYPQYSLAPLQTTWDNAMQIIRPATSPNQLVFVGIITSLVN